MSQLELFTRESLLLEKPVIMSADELLQGSLALAAFRYRGLQGEVFDNFSFQESTPLAGLSVDNLYQINSQSDRLN